MNALLGAIKACGVTRFLASSSYSSPQPIEADLCLAIDSIMTIHKLIETFETLAMQVDKPEGETLEMLKQGEIDESLYSRQLYGYLDYHFEAEANT